MKIFGHKNPDTDTIVSAIVLADLQNKLGQEAIAYRLGELNKETQFVLDYFDVKTPELLVELTDGNEVALVDHNEFGQSALGIEKATIRMVVDHHRVADFKCAEPLTFRAEPVGCTATILYKLYLENEMIIDKTIAGLMASAIVSDSLLFKSPTCTEIDERVCRQLAEMAGLDIERYGMEMLKAGTDLSDYDAAGLLGIDAKMFDMNGTKVEIAQINTVDIDELMKRKDELMSEMERLVAKKELDLFLVALTDIVHSNSQVIAVGSRLDLVCTAFDVKLVDQTAFIPGIVSRKKQIVPVLEANV